MSDSQNHVKSIFAATAVRKIDKLTAHIPKKSSFVGRVAEISDLNAALQRASVGKPAVVLLGGEAGIGKTRLLQEFLVAAEEAGAITAVGTCQEIGVAEPSVAPLRTALHRLHQALAAELGRATRGSGELIADLLPDLCGPACVPTDEHRFLHLFAHVINLLEKLENDRTIVVAVEDLHWSDGSTRALLAHLIRSLNRVRVMVVATYRTDDLHRWHPLHPYLSAIEQLRNAQRLELGRLSSTEVQQQLASLLDTSKLERSPIAWIYEVSEGNPFFVEELARAYHDMEVIRLKNSQRGILVARLEVLPEQAQQVIKVAASGGASVEHVLLSAVLNLAEDDLFDALLTAVQAHVLVPRTESGSYGFRHPLMHAAVLADLLPGERSQINRRYAAALQSHPELLPVHQRAGRLANYWYHAHDPVMALRTALEAGRQARRVNAYSQQLLMLERALELWDQVSVDELYALRCYEVADGTYPGCRNADGDGTETGRLRFVDVLADATVAARRSGNPELSARLARTAARFINEDAEPQHAAWFALQRSRAVPPNRP